MKKRIGIEYEGVEGWVIYDSDNPTNFEVNFPDEQVVKRVTDYLTTERQYKIPESGEMDDYRVERAMPTDSEMYFELTMSTLANTGVWVKWGKG